MANGSGTKGKAKNTTKGARNNASKKTKTAMAPRPQEKPKPKKNKGKRIMATRSKSIVA